MLMACASSAGDRLVARRLNLARSSSTVLPARRRAVTVATRRVDAAQQVRAAGRRVGVGRLPQRRQARSIASSRHARAVADLDDGAGVEAARAGGDVVALLVAPTGDVVGEQPPRAPAQVEAGEHRNDDQSLHRRRRLPRTIIDSWLALPSRLSAALDLLVVLQLQLEQLDHLHRRAGGAGDRDPL